MKTALCLSGYFSSTRDISSKGIDGYNHIKKHILDKVDVDVYIHSWDVFNKELILGIYKDILVDHLFEPQINFQYVVDKNKLNTISVRPNEPPFWTAFSQWYSIQKSFELMLKSNINYDCVIKGRFDLGRINRSTTGPHNPGNPYPVQCINFDPNLDMKHFYMAGWQYFETEGPPDMWFYSNLENMKHFSRVFDILSEDIIPESPYEMWCGKNDGGMLNAIKCWKWFLIRTRLWELSKPLKTNWE